jgi:uncharacterized protein (DUF58 family)
VTEATAGSALVFPLIPRRASSRLQFAGQASRRRGGGAEIAGSRPYRRGDTMRLVDWHATARLSSARGRDEIVVRETFAEDALRVVLVVDRSPSMALFPAGLPWLHKPSVVSDAGRMILASAAGAHAQVGFADAGLRGPVVEPPRRNRALVDAAGRRLDGDCDGPADSLDRALRALTRSVAEVSAGSFVFVLSDFLPPPSPAVMRGALAAGWDVVPVVVRDPVWESSFPAVGGVTLPLADPLDHTVSLVRLTGAEAAARRAANEARTAALRDELARLGVDAVLLADPAPTAVHRAFLSWAERRARAARPGWRAG